MSGVSDKAFVYEGTESDFDDVFMYDNVIVLLEYTTRQSSGLSEHIKKKKVLYDKILADPPQFIEFYGDKFPTFKDSVDQSYLSYQYKLRIVYCPLNHMRTELKDEVPGVAFLEYNIARYFDVVTKTVKKSSRFEVFDFLGLESKDIGDAVRKPLSYETDVYPGSVLPEGHSNFGKGYKVVSFYIDPAALLQRAYVLRRHGWRAGATVYQRMISQAKVEAVRKYLKEKRRVFINNIIVTLPDDTMMVGLDKKTIDPEVIKETQPGNIQIPKGFNSIGVVDGQHRVFSYHEGGAFDEEISKLRLQQNLLVTGVIFPKGMAEEERLKFEAQLFLEINSNQTNARSDLKQEINLVINPFAQDSVAKRVVNYMNDVSGPLRDEFERAFYDKDKLKTTSVVSFGVRPLVGTTGEDSLFRLWAHADKNVLIKGEDHALLAEYVKYCATEINHFLAACRNVLPKDWWTAEKGNPNRFLTTTNVNGLIACLRRVSRAGTLADVDGYSEKLNGLEQFDFKKYKSSQYNRMGEAIYAKHFAQTAAPSGLSAAVVDPPE